MYLKKKKKWWGDTRGEWLQNFCLTGPILTATQHWGTWILMSSILIVRTLTSEVNTLQPDRCNTAVVLRLNKV